MTLQLSTVWRCVKATVFVLVVLGPATRALAQQAKEPNIPQGGWEKVCEDVTATSGEKGKEKTGNYRVCLTKNERFDPQPGGLVRFSAAIREVSGQGKQYFMVSVPLGGFIPPGLQIIVYPEELWQRVQRREPVDNSRLVPIPVPYTQCYPGGCDAELEVTPQLLNALKSGSGLVIYVIRDKSPVGYPVPLTGFSAALTGAAIDRKTYNKEQKELLDQISKPEIKGTITLPKSFQVPPR